MLPYLTNLIAWYDASQLTGLSNGDPVTSWTDMSGNGYNATNGSLSAPTYQTNTLNTLPTIKFVAGSSQALRATPTIATTSAWTMFVVARQTPGGANHFRVVGSIYPEHANWLLGWHGGYESVAYYEGWVAQNTQVSTETWRIFTGQGDGASTGYLYAEGTLVAGNTGGWFSTAGGLAFSGYSLTTTNELSDCDIAEVIYYSEFLNNTNRSAVENYLNNKYFVDPFVGFQVALI